MKSLPLKLAVAVIVIFGVVITGMLIYRPLKIRYYAGKYENSTDPAERIRIVDILCKSEAGKKALYDAFRRRCISEQVKIPAGSFMMGSEKGNPNEMPVHKVALSSFRMDKYEVSNEKYYVFVKSTGHKAPEPAAEYRNFDISAVQWENSRILEGLEQHPVNWISWKDVKAYADWLGMRLPTEAEWEYACRAGSTTEYCFGDDEKLLVEYVWFRECFDAWGGSDGEEKPHAVGEKKPNAWGLYDMHGNVWEYCSDWFDDKYYKNSPPDSPKGPVSGDMRVLRGGCWGGDMESIRSARRERIEPKRSDYCYAGFRVCF
ncbi:MAG: formylglycine-generating enzyme family protein [Planctomycetota bacterium]|jgi:formylglycine-generating enzyme required for sulfatase activity